MEVFLQCNSNMVMLDKVASRGAFLRKHNGMLMVKKPVTQRSSTITNLINTLKVKTRLPHNNRRKVIKTSAPGIHLIEKFTVPNQQVLKK